VDNKLTKAVTDIVKILSPLDSDERLRVVNASLTLLGDRASPTPPSDSSQEASNRGGVGTLQVSPQARAWLNKNSLSDEELENWYDVQQDSATLLTLPGTTSKRSQQTINTYILLGFAAFLGSGDASFRDQDARARCEHFGCYDATNHSKIYKAFGNKITGSKSTGWKLTAPGMSAAKALLKSSAAT
jgi:hypothetical protein